MLCGYAICRINDGEEDTALGVYRIEPTFDFSLSHSNAVDW